MMSMCHQKNSLQLIKQEPSSGSRELGKQLLKPPLSSLNTENGGENRFKSQTWEQEKEILKATQGVKQIT